MQLGSEIAKQLGEIAEHDLLTSWMSEYIGEKLSAAKRARGRQREALEKEIADLILKLWDRRHHLPNGTRPFESFEPLFVALNELSQDRPRYSILRNLPPIDKKSPVGKVIQGALAIDQSASALIWYLLAEAVGKIPKRDKRWVKILTEFEPSPWDVQIVRIAIDNAEATSDKQEKMEKLQLEKLQTMLAKLEHFEKLTAHLRALLKKKIQAPK